MVSRLALLLLCCLLFSCSSSKKTGSTGISHENKRNLILTADDFGASQNINEGIRIAADNNAITAISVLTNFTESLPDLKEISRNHPHIGIGVHLNIVTGKPILSPEDVPSLVNEAGNFYTISELLPKVKHISSSELYKELRAQIMALKIMDIPIDHLSDQNGILSFYSPFFDVVIELAREFSLPVRSPLIASKKYPSVFSNSEIKKRYRQLALNLALSAPFKALNLMKYSKVEEMEGKVQKLDESGILHPDLLIETMWGNPSASNMLYILEHLPPGTSEITLHFGTKAGSGEYPSGLNLDYFNNREYELLTLTSEYLKRYYENNNIQTVGYTDLEGE